MLLVFEAPVQPEVFCDLTRLWAKAGDEKLGLLVSSYRIVSLANSPGLATGINANGQVVGFLRDPRLAIHWTVNPSGTIIATVLERQLTIAGQSIAFYSVAVDINDQGIIAGGLENSATGSGWRPVIWLVKNASPIALPIAAGILATGGEAYAVSNQLVNMPGLKAVAVGRIIEVYAGNQIIYVSAWAIRDDNSLADPILLGIGTSLDYESVAIDINSSLSVVGSLNHQAMRWSLVWDGQVLRKCRSIVGLELGPSSS